MSALAAAGLVAVVWHGTPAVSPIYLLVFVFGVSRAFAMPAGQSLMPNLVPKEDFGNAVAWSSSAWQTATVVGPALGGLLYVFGARWSSVR